MRVFVTRSPHTMGDDVPSPAGDARHARFWLALHVVGSVVSNETPWPEGPRHCGQFQADNSLPARTIAERIRMQARGFVTALTRDPLAG